MQYKILEIIFKSSRAANYFSGWYSTSYCVQQYSIFRGFRFSSFCLEENQFNAVANEVKAGLDALGLKTEVDTVTAGCIPRRVKLPEVLFVNELSPFQEEKILIQIDTTSHEYPYSPDTKF